MLTTGTNRGLARACTAVSTALLFVACGGGDGAGDGSMVRMQPPQDWRETLSGARAARDHEIRDGVTSPLTAEEAEAFPGLDFFAPDESYYYVGSIRHYAEPERFDIVTSAGKTRPCEKVGWIRFESGGSPMTLQVYRLLDIDPGSGGRSYFLPFMDATTAEATYPGGRYVELEGPPGGPFVLDFNRAYNPLCAYAPAERFACPVTPPENRLSARIEAGERGFIDHGASG